MPSTACPTDGRAPAVRRWLRRALTGTTTGGLLLGGLAVVMPYDGPTDAPASAITAPTDLRLAASNPRPHPWKGHPGRQIRYYTVRPGDTAIGLAVKHHAWTSELLALNHLTMRSHLHVGQRLRIPVVVAAARKASTKSHQAKAAKTKTHKGKAAKHKEHQVKRHWVNADASRAKVRRIVVRTARKHGVDHRLALAVAWQESGWQQRRVSSAGAIGVMQVMPATGEWMSVLAGRKLNLCGLYDNITAGVLLLKTLRAQVGPRKATASYYQGLASVQQRGMYPSTRHYVRNVLAIRGHLIRGWDPA